MSSVLLLASVWAMYNYLRVCPQTQKGLQLLQCRWAIGRELAGCAAYRSACIGKVSRIRPSPS